MHLIDIEPIKDQIIVSAKRYEAKQFDKDGIMQVVKISEATGDYKEYQVIEKLGPDVIEKYPELHIGDTVMLDPTAFTYHRGRQNSVAQDDPNVHISYDEYTVWPIIKYGPKGTEEHMLIHHRDVIFKILDYKD